MDALLQNIPVGILATVLLGLVIGKILIARRRPPNSPPAVPGWPLIGNLLQLKEKKPYKTFAKWAEDYGPIYSIKLGASSVVVLNSIDIVKEALVSKYSSISTKKLSKPMTTLSGNKSIVALSDYGDYYKMVKQYIASGFLGTNAQKRNRHHRDTLIENVMNFLFSKIKDEDLCLVEFRETLESELFGLSLKQSLGKDIEFVHMEDTKVTMTKKEIFQILVTDPLMGAIEVDWRDFFPYLRWVPNKSLELKIQQMETRKRAILKKLIEEQQRDSTCEEEISCYLDYLQSVENTLTEEQIIALIWESILESSDTTLVTIEWAMYELAKNPTCQDHLYKEIKRVCGSTQITEEHLPHLRYLKAVFHESLRFHSPVAIIPPRHVHEDTQLGGYNIPAGTDIIINLYACNMNNKDWEEPGNWKPERFLSEQYEQMGMHKTMSFGGGKRACAGTLQAMLISCTTIGRLIQEFHWQLKDGEEDNTDTVQFITQKLYPMQAYIRLRDA